MSAVWSPAGETGSAIAAAPALRDARLGAIFATVGSQMPFDRLVRALDAWAGRHPAFPVFAQIGDSPLKPRHLESCRVLTPAEFRHRVAAARVIVAHAGMGSVLTAMEFGKPLVLLPRRGDLRETRNDHQVATARWLARKPGIQVALEARELDAALSRAIEGGERAGAPARAPATDALLDFLSRYATQLASELGDGAPSQRRGPRETGP